MINFSKRNLIGFAGTIGSGKDTATEILNYQRLQGTYATYKAWKELADELDIPFDEKDNEKLRGVSRMESLDIILEKS